MIYEYARIKDNEYLVTIQAESEDDEAQSFEVVVFESEDEIEELVQAYLEAKSNAAIPTEPVVQVPYEVSMGQCRLALYDIHQITTDEEFFALTDMLPQEQQERARLELRTRTSVQRDNPLVVGVCQAMGWDIDELFTYAATL